MPMELLSLNEALTGQIYAFMVIFSRLGTAFMLLPGFGDAYVSARIRLLLALAITVVVQPILMPMLPPVPAGSLGMTVLIVKEGFIGVFLGTITRLLTAALDTAGTLISMQIGLSNAFMFNPALASQGTLIGAYMGYIGVVLLFVTDLDHLLILAVVGSYEVFVPGAALPMGDFAEMTTKMVGQSFAIGAQMAAPFLAVGIMFNLAVGLLQKMMPQFQAFAVIMGGQVALGLALFAIVISATMLFWLRTVQDTLIGLLG
ncbi:flagellar biosynthetic protein FliR [Skermanella mucosa]|uniref:flagellar biosynthetic protein FliR n=1 Tax=Skermanella mucosa TaxID=1789672 RepID=UPI001E5C9148|nr:flagellar biosynthetic protein FliR [Skermanella mucosa]UEM20177.1 flagellar biosynthetic protein FliR [Skermanella mucosa]